MSCDNLTAKIGCQLSLKDLPCYSRLADASTSSQGSPLFSLSLISLSAKLTDIGLGFNSHQVPVIVSGVQLFDSVVNKAERQKFSFEYWARLFAQRGANGADLLYPCCVAMFGWGNCSGSISYIPTSYELHGAYLSEIHCPDHIHGS
ncbi:hypothetical protein Ancab_002891, partial [Ancistrocladus abbreviatus]